MANGILTGGTSVPTARRRARSRLLTKEEERQQDLLRNLLSGARSTEERVGLQAGAGFGSGLARGLFGDPLLEGQVDKDPEVMEAEESLALAQQMQGLTQGEDAVEVGSFDFFSRAAQVANEAGRPAMALQLGQQAVEARKAEELTAAKARQTKITNFSKLPTDAQLIAITEDPTILSDVRPDMSAKQLTSAATKIQGVVDARRLKNLQELNKIKTAKVTRATKNDVNQVGSLLEGAGLGSGAFTKWLGFAEDPEAFGRFAVRMADQVLAEQDQQAQQGIRMSRDQVIQEIRDDLEESLALTIDGEDVTGIDAKKLDKVLRDRLVVQPKPGEPGGGDKPTKRKGILKL